MEYKQFDFNLDRFKFNIEKDGLKIEQKRFSSSNETIVEFERIGDKTMKEKNQKTIWLILSILFFFIAFYIFIKRMNGKDISDSAEIIWLSISLIFFSVFLLTKENMIFLVGNDDSYSVEFINRKTYKKSLNEFITQLIIKRDEYLINKYFNLDEYKPYKSQHKNLLWLYELKLITKNQLSEKLNELDNLKIKTGHLGRQ